MTRDANHHWQRLSALVDAVLDLEPAARAAYLERVCPGDKEIQTEVEALLALGLTSHFLDSGALGFAVPLLDVGEAAVEDESPLPNPGRTDDLLRALTREHVMNLAGSWCARQSVGSTSGGTYELERELGRGGTATVYLGHDTKHDRSVAVKVLHGELATLFGAERFVHEIRLTAQLQHPHILGLLDSGVFDQDAGPLAGRPFYTMPYVDGESLRGRLERGQVPLVEALSILRDMARALAYAHERGIVHRDIKPENVLLSGSSAVISDFGIAKALQLSSSTQPQTLTELASERLSPPSSTLGTPAYIAPEQASGNRQVDPRADVYAWGVVAYELLSGRHPFAGRANPRELLAAHISEAPRPLSQVAPGVPRALGALVMRCLSKLPSERPAAGSEILATLGTIEGNATTAHGLTAMISRKPGSSVIAATIVVLTLVMVLTRNDSGGQERRGELRQNSATAAIRTPLTRESPTENEVAGDQSGGTAVLYFTDLTEDRNLTNLSAALTEGTIDALARRRRTNVISKQGVETYRDTVASDLTIAKVLGVRTLVHGTLDRRGVRVRVTLWIVDGPTGRESGREVVEGSSPDSPPLRSSVVREILRLLEEGSFPNSNARTQASLLLERAERACNKGLSLMASGDLRRARSAFALADSLLRRSEVTDPQWIEPRSQRAALELRRASLESSNTMLASRLLDTAIAVADSVLIVDGNNPTALETRGTGRFYRLERVPLADDTTRALADVSLAERDLTKAVRIAPREASAWSTLSLLRGWKNNVVGEDALQRSTEADPEAREAPDLAYTLWAESFDLGLFADAEHWCADARVRYPNDYRFVRCQLFDILLPGARVTPTKAWALLDTLKRLSPESTRDVEERATQMLVAVAVGRAGLRDSSNALIRAAQLASGELLGYEAIVRLQLGEREAALSLLEAYIHLYPQQGLRLARHKTWMWRDLEQDARFRAIASGSG